MNAFQPSLIRLLAPFAAIALAASCSAARAQDRKDNRGIVVLPGRDLVAPEDDPFEPAEQLDQRALGAGDTDEARRRLESRLKSRIEQIHRDCDLTLEQRNKLAVAGRGDIKRAFARLDELRSHSSALRDLAKRHQALVELINHRQSMTETDCFGEGSLFSKILKNTLTPQQVASHQKAAMAHHRATIGWVVRSVDTWLRLSPEQHQKLEELLIAETRPPRKWGEYDYYGIMCQAAKLSENRLKPIFDDDQWQKIQKQLAEAIRLEKLLRIGGFLPDDDSVKRTAAVPKVSSGR